MAEARIRELLSGALAPSEIVLEDISGGCGSAFKLIVVSDKFEGLRLLARQRLVNDAVKGVDMHAMTMKTFTEKEWIEQKAKN